MTGPDDARDNPPLPPPPPSHAPEVDEDAGISRAPPGGALGDQVDPRTQTSEADGHRTLVNPVRDPGPYIKEGGIPYRHPDKSKGEHRIGDANDGVDVTMRTSTGHDRGFGNPGGKMHGTVTLPAEVVASGAASDVYNKEQGKTLTEVAERKSGEGRPLAPVHE